LRGTAAGISTATDDINFKGSNMIARTATTMRARLTIPAQQAACSRWKPMAPDDVDDR